MEEDDVSSGCASVDVRRAVHELRERLKEGAATLDAQEQSLGASLSTTELLRDAVARQHAVSARVIACTAPMPTMHDCGSPAQMLAALQAQQVRALFRQFRILRVPEQAATSICGIPLPDCGAMDGG